MSGLLNLLRGSGGEKLILVGVTYPNDQGYQAQELMPYGLGNYQYSPLVWTILDKTFISVTGNESPSKYYLYILDHFSGKVSNAVDTGLLCETELDIHHIAAIIGTDLNKLLITETSKHGSAANWKYSKTPVGYDVNNFPAWTDSGVNQFTYHQVKKFANGDIYDVGRNSASSLNVSTEEIYKSTDDGVSFSLIGVILDWGSQPDENRYGAYPMLIFSDDDILRLYINKLHTTWVDPVSTFIGGPVTYYLESIDGGVTWRNIYNTFSKDIVATSPLTLAEMDTNMKMWDLGTASHVIRANGSAIIDGNPYSIGGSGVLTNSPLALYYWSGSAWIQKVVTSAGHTIQPAYDNGVGLNNNAIGIFQNGTDIDLLCTELVSGNVQLSRFRTSDSGTTWSFIEQLTSNAATHRNAHINKNLDISDFRAVACVVNNGDSTDRLFVTET